MPADASSRAVFERLFGFSEPVTTGDGSLEYACAFCDARSPDGSAPHRVDCSYWSALPLFHIHGERLLRSLTR